ncbi:hypothetical protein IU500_20905 [Nocardia terpenica]|uniref:hypothetical protein n=1 Tax=Nocardia terpenica TaxID=455432 RepID=UPI0018942C3E|nr:hypothetical protein [Nocardia terpenica]MBF6064163.1 hypothetical protein [Nocardia terpenica]MBF6106496.1 hypothetical protein [Nocardia terpenica]MBF6113781.1 hypothetical protein [Nocardia terpenica]MBF6120595.1 hypothetical protein [Nocardia terpenica]MBF6154748.1 hypothetical protein [Nocardia terpenica]
MPVHYVRVKTTLDNFSPAVRPTGNLVIIGDATANTPNVPVEVTTPGEAAAKFSAPGPNNTPPPVLSALSNSLILAMQQNPAPNQIWGIKTGTALADALTAAEALNVQFVVLANTPLTADSAKAGGAIAALQTHVDTVSNAGDGKERMGVAMLAKGVTDPTLVAGPLADDRMVFVAHQSDADAASAVAGTIAGYPPSTSMVLKQVSIASAPFTNAQIDAINGAEGEDGPPAGNGVIWLTSPVLLGNGTYLGEGYTGNRGKYKYIDVQRTIDDVTFKLKARLIGAIGNLRISRSGLRALVVAMEAELNPLVADGVLDGYVITIPILNLLDADPSTLTDAQIQAVHDAHTNRWAQALVNVEYAGAMHRINVDLKFN